MLYWILLLSLPAFSAQPGRCVQLLERYGNLHRQRVTAPGKATEERLVYEIPQSNRPSILKKNHKEPPPVLKLTVRLMKKGEGVGVFKFGDLELPVSYWRDGFVMVAFPLSDDFFIQGSYRQISDEETKAGKLVGPKVDVELQIDARTWQLIEKNWKSTPK